MLHFVASNSLHQFSAAYNGLGKAREIHSGSSYYKTAQIYHIHYPISKGKASSLAQKKLKNELVIEQVERGNFFQRM